jgi:hypothetical protein
MNTMIPIQQRLSIKTAPINQALHQFECDLRVAIPCIVVANQNGDAFNASLQTVSVQPAIQEVILVNAIRTPTTLPILDDVPILLPRAGGFSLTFPIAIGDECMVVFQDMGIDNWWQSGGVKPQPSGKLYRHDIGDAVAIFGVASNPRALAGYSTTSAQLRSDDGSTVLDLIGGKITVKADAVELNGALELTGTVIPASGYPTNALEITINGTPYRLLLQAG